MTPETNLAADAAREDAQHPPTDADGDLEVTVGPATAVEMERWDDLVAASPHGTPFHRRAVLSVLADHADARLRPLVGRADGEVVGLLPAFVGSTGPFRTAFSPPPGLGIPYLGPALVGDGRQWSVARRNRTFVRACLAWLDEEVAPDFLHLRTAVGYADVRPLSRAGCEVTPRYTYVVDLEGVDGTDELLARFSSDARSNVRGDADCVVREEGREAVGRVVAAVRERFAEQGEPVPFPPGLPTDLYDALPDGAVRPYVCRVGGAFAGGVLALDGGGLGHDGGGTVYRWQGGVRTDAGEGIAVNDRVDWAVMRDALERGRSGYDFDGANVRRICRYKAKFGPDLRAYYAAERATPLASAAADAYESVQSVRARLRSLF